MKQLDQETFETLRRFEIPIHFNLPFCGLEGHKIYLFSNDEQHLYMCLKRNKGFGFGDNAEWAKIGEYETT